MTGIVIAHHLENLDFLLEWDEFKSPDVHLYICEDKEQGVCSLPEGYNGTIFDHRSIDEELQETSWIIPRITSAIKSYGFYRAWKDDCDVIITIDNDCFPDQHEFVEKHRRQLSKKVTLGWTNTINAIYPRGVPYGIREESRVMLNHGLWSNIPDLDAPTSLQFPNLRLQPAEKSEVIPLHNYYAMCGMNLAFNAEIAPLMYFGLQGSDYPYDRFDDIWAGIFSKKILDHLRYAVTSGRPSVEHRKQSNVFRNLIKEAPGIEVNEVLWKVVDQVELTETTPISCYRELMEKIELHDEYFEKLKEATQLWLDLFDRKVSD